MLKFQKTFSILSGVFALSLSSLSQAQVAPPPAFFGAGQPYGQNPYASTMMPPGSSPYAPGMGGPSVGEQPPYSQGAQGACITGRNDNTSIAANQFADPYRGSPYAPHN